ncbi:MAG: ABC transporter permease [Acidobacteriaceae bacterium]|nr:ABC transporter permease [Acidobacteriaceae bacterium]MBV9779262.1 ABC transporter permease [Acidobacteriaceae bacterium]
MFERSTNVWLRLKALFNRRRLDRDLDEEIRFHLAMREQKQREMGLSTEAARYATQQRFGNVTLVKERTREMHTFLTVESLWQDVRWAARGLRKSPGFLATVVLSLALGIGANSTMFSVINALMYRPLPYFDPGSLMVIWEFEQGHPESEEGPPIAELVDWNTQNHVFEDIALTSDTEGEPMAGLGEPEMIHQQFVTPNFFSVLRVKPVLGRIFSKGEMQDRSQAVVISHSFWEERFSKDPKAIGKAFQIAGVESTVVGIMPSGFAPFYGQKIDLWVPINPESARYSERKDRGWLMPIGRLKPGVTRGQAQVEMNLIERRLEQEYPRSNTGVRAKVLPLQEAVFGWARALYPLLGAVAFVLLIACLNVANLLQSRTEARRKEQAIRGSLGAPRRRLIQQVLIESGLLALLGGTLGVGFALLGIQLFRNLAENFPNTGAISIDGRVLLFTLSVSLLTAMLFGLGPAVQASRPDLNATLREGGHRTSAGARGRMRNVLAVSEVAFAMVLLIGAGLMINTVLHLTQVNPGFDPTNVMVARISLPEGGKYLERVPGGDMEKVTPLVTAFYRRLLEKLSVVPEIESVGMMSGMAREISFSVLGHPAPPPENRPSAVYQEASASLLETLRIPLKKGRFLRDSDRENMPWAAVVNETFARRYFPNENPIGQRVLLRHESYHVDEERPREIVGVIGDVRTFGLRENVPPMVYSSYLQQSAIYPGGCVLSHLSQDVVARLGLGSSSQNNFASIIKKAAQKIDLDQPVTTIMAMSRHLADSIDDFRLIMRLLEIFAGMALLLAIVGIYGVMSYFVSERIHEIGIRMALGAERWNVLALVTKLGLKLTVIGVATGAVLAVWLARLITRFLYGVSPADPTTLVVVGLVLATIALLACYIPAHRATKVDPVLALRHE